MLKAALAIVAVLSSSVVHAQSLGDIAKKTADEHADKAVKVYTNADLKVEPAPFVPAHSDPAPSAGPSVPATPPPSSIADYRQSSMKDEAYWKGRMRDAQAVLDGDQIHLDAMIGRVNSLSSDFNNSRSVTQRIVLRKEREDAATEATRLKAAVRTDRKALVTLEEEARRVGVPAGWLRP